MTKKKSQGIMPVSAIQQRSQTIAKSAVARSKGHNSQQEMKSRITLPTLRFMDEAPPEPIAKPRKERQIEHNGKTFLIHWEFNRDGEYRPVIFLKVRNSQQRWSWRRLEPRNYLIYGEISKLVEAK